MKQQKRHISIEEKLFIGIVITILISVISGYIYSNYFVGRTINENIILFIVGIAVFLITIISFLAAIALTGTLLGEILSNHDAKKSYLKSKEQIKALPSNFVNVHFKDFDSFRLASFVDSEDISCFAKLDENGKVVYAIQLNVEYETDDYQTFLTHFDV